MPLVSALAGAGLGSFSAYKLNLSQIKLDEQRKEIGVLTKVIFDLEKMLNDVLSAKKQCIIPFHYNRLRFIDIPPQYGDIQYLDITIDPELAPVVVKFKKSSFSSLVNISAKRYKSYVALSKMRGDLYRESFHIIGDSDKTLKSLDVHELSNVLGIHRVMAMYQVTENYLNATNDAAISLYCSMCCLIKLLNDNYNGDFKGIALSNRDELMSLLQLSPEPILTDRRIYDLSKQNSYEEHIYSQTLNSYKIN